MQNGNIHVHQFNLNKKLFMKCIIPCVVYSGVTRHLKAPYTTYFQKNLSVAKTAKIISQKRIFYNITKKKKTTIVLISKAFFAIILSRILCSLIHLHQIVLNGFQAKVLTRPISTY